MAAENDTPNVAVEPKEPNSAAGNGNANAAGNNERSRDGETRARSERGGRGHYNNNNNSRGRGGFKNRGGSKFKPRGGGVKTRFDERPESNDATKIRNQVEFYFSDSNLPIDQFLLTEVGGKENKPLSLKVIHAFKRMRNFQPFSAVVDAVKGSSFLVVNDKDEVYRKEPLADHFSMSVAENIKLLNNDNMKRSIYAKGFGPEGNKTAFEIEEFFQPYGIRGVRLRRYNDRSFKGSVFVEFTDEETATRFLALDPKPEFKGNELLFKSKKAYVDEKNEAILNGDIEPRSPRRPYGGASRGNYHKRDSNKHDHKRRRGRDDDENDGDNSPDPDNWRERRDRFQDKRRKANDGERAPADQPNDDADTTKEPEATAGAEAAEEAPAEAAATAPEEPSAEATEQT